MDNLSPVIPVQRDKSFSVNEKKHWQSKTVSNMYACLVKLGNETVILIKMQGEEMVLCETSMTTEGKQQIQRFVECDSKKKANLWERIEYNQIPEPIAGILDGQIKAKINDLKS